MNGSSKQTDFPSQGRLLGLDFGTKRLGVAVSTFEQTIASPLQNYTRQGETADARLLIDLVKEYGIAGLVIGLPVHMSGDEGQKARESREFGEWAGKTTGLPIHFWDERFTTAMAEQHLMAAQMTSKQRKARLDKLAAQIMLKSFLEAPDRDAGPPPLL